MTPPTTDPAPDAAPIAGAKKTSLAEAAEKLAIARWDREFAPIPWSTAISAGLAAKRLMQAARDLGANIDGI